MIPETKHPPGEIISVCSLSILHLYLSLDICLCVPCWRWNTKSALCQYVFVPIAWTCSLVSLAGAWIPSLLSVNMSLCQAHEHVPWLSLAVTGATALSAGWSAGWPVSTAYLHQTSPLHYLIRCKFMLRYSLLKSIYIYFLIFLFFFFISFFIL